MGTAVQRLHRRMREKEALARTSSPEKFDHRERKEIGAPRNEVNG